MVIKLIQHSATFPLDLPANKGFDLTEIKAILQRLEEFGVSWEIINTTTLSDKELSNLYTEAVLPAVYKKYHVRQVFGSKRNSGFLFGKGVPALLVSEPGQQYPTDVYPHRNGDGVVTIRAFLEGLLKKMEKAPITVEPQEIREVLVRRMDRLRRKIGPIGASVAELIREGRRR